MPIKGFNFFKNRNGMKISKIAPNQKKESLMHQIADLLLLKILLNSTSLR